MTDLGPGVRVYVGWTPDQFVHAGPNGEAPSVDGRCRTGTITDGPFPPGKIFRDEFGHLRQTEQVMFNVAIDGDGSVASAEKLLFPIDDDNDNVDIDTDVDVGEELPA